MIRLLKFARSRTACLMALCFAAAFSQASAQVTDLIQKNVDDSARVKLSGSVHPMVKKSQDQGSVSGSLPMQRMVMVLNRSDKQEQALTATLSSLQDKASPSYHKWLTPDQFGAQFGISDNDVAKVTSWLKQEGFTVNSVGRGRQWIEFSGTAAQVETALKTQIDTLTYKNEKHIANVSAISIPEALSPAVRGVLSLNDFHKTSKVVNPTIAHRQADGTWSMKTAKQSPTGGKLQPDLTFDTGPYNEGVIYALAPGDLSNIYNTAPLLKNGTNGSGVAIAIVGRSDILMSDIESYRQIFSLPANDPNIIINGSDPGDVADDDVESTLDVELSGAMAPNATIDFVESASTNTSDGVDLSALYIVDNVIAPIMSTSYGACEAEIGTAGNAFYNSLWEQAAAEGITSMVSAGDQGSGGCDTQDLFGDVTAYGPAVNGLASTPYNVAVGGTEFNENGLYGNFWNGANAANLSSAIGYIPEQIWNQSCDESVTYCPPDYITVVAAGGGGPSSCAVQDALGNCISGYTKPSWQVGVGVPADGVRDVPDISLTAAGSGLDAYVLCFEGSCSTDTVDGQTYITNFDEVGGTSASSPSFAGILSLIEQKNGTFQGQINTTLYQLFAASDPTKCNSSSMTDPTVTTTCMFYDITAGSDATPGETGFHATTGYDFGSGIGSVNAANLLNGWSSASKLSTATTATTSATTFTHGQSVNVAVQVKSTTGTAVPSGDIALITDKYGAAAAATLVNGAVTAPVTTLPGGTYNLTAKYAGDGTFSTSTSTPIALTVNPEDAVITLSSFTQTGAGNDIYPPVTTSTASYGAYFPLRADVAGKSGQGTPSGAVSFYDGGVLLGKVALNTEASATLPTGFPPGLVGPNSMPIYLSVGTHAITASYTGDNSFNAVKASATYVVTITRAAPLQIATSTSQFYVPVGTTINITAGLVYPWTGVFGAPADPTGTIQFTILSQTIGTPQPIVEDSINQGQAPVPQALLSYSFSTAGSGPLGATYAGDANYLPATTASSIGYQVYLQVYNPGMKTPQVSVTATPSNPTIGQSVNYIIKVAADKAGDPLPTGTVSVSGAGINYYSSQYYTGTLVNGVATFTTTAIQAGDALTYANYNGDSNYSSGASPAISVLIAKAVPTVNLTTPSPYVALNTQTTLSAAVVGDPAGGVVADVTGSVQFFDAVNGAAAQPIGIAHAMLGTGFLLATTLPAGTNVITVQYFGDTNWVAATSKPVTINVINADYQITSGTTVVDLSAGGSTTVPLTITPLLGFNQPITLSCGSGLPVGVTCSFSPAAVTPAGTPVTAILTLTSKGAYTIATRTKWITGGTSLGLATLAFLMLPRRRRRAGLLAIALFSVAVSSVIGCAGSSALVSSMTLTSSSVKVATGQPITFTASLNVDGSSPTGSVTFFDGNTTLGTQAIGSSVASLTTSSLALGTHTITANYGGDKNHEIVTAGPLYEAVTGSASLSVTATAGTDTHTVPLTLTLQ